MKRRIPELDVLRGIAVLLVIYVHLQFFSDWYSPSLPPLLRRVVANTAKHGWIGVDLFFVLSGYLISSLLFSEFNKSGTINGWWFLIRRGFKIYPPFWTLIAITLLVDAVRGVQVPRKELLAEMVYFQNYFPGLWGHTWSLAVEEHFYILLPITLVILLKINSGSSNPFSALPILFGVLLAAALTLRMGYLANGVTPEKHWAARMDSHFRFDALLFGVLLCYWSTFKNVQLSEFLGWNRLPQVAASCLLIVTPLCFNVLTSFFANTIGYTMIYLGCGLAMVQLLAWNSPAKARLMKKLFLVARIGEDSYSIYLWHLPVRSMAAWLSGHMILSPGIQAVVAILIYVPRSILMGMLMATLVEKPALRLRDRLFPSKSADLPIVTPK